jgi:hypothetical protein
MNSFKDVCLGCDETVPTSVAYGVKNLQKEEGDVVTVCFIKEHKKVWTGPQAKGQLRALLARSFRFV